MVAKEGHVLGIVLFCCLTLENDTPGNCILVTGVAVVSFIIDFSYDCIVQDALQGQLICILHFILCWWLFPPLWGRGVYILPGVMGLQNLFLFDPQALCEQVVGYYHV